MKFFVSIVLSALILSGSNNTNHLQARVLEKILLQVHLNKEMKIYSDNKKILSTLKDNGELITVDSYEDATLLILENKDNLKMAHSNKVIFVLKYNLLADIPQSFGALFWKKGRPNIIIIHPRIKSQAISISSNLEPYLEEKIW